MKQASRTIDVQSFIGSCTASPPTSDWTAVGGLRGACRRRASSACSSARRRLRTRSSAPAWASHRLHGWHGRAKPSRK